MRIAVAGHPATMSDAHPDLAADTGFAPPRALRPVWVVLALLAAIEGLYEVVGSGGHHPLLDDWLHNVVTFSAALLCLGRAAYEPHGRAAWTAIGVGLLAWALGEVSWTLLYDDDASPPFPTLSDALWLAWYPLTALGIALLIRLQVGNFELHRWMDGLAVTLLVLTPALALFIEPVAAESEHGWLATVIEFGYPILDALLVGAILGVYTLLDWRPGRTWLLLGLGGMLMAVGDALFAVQQARDSLVDHGYDLIWTVGALLIACAAWSSVLGPVVHVRPTGWRAIALPLAAQAIAAAIQIYGLFHELGPTERIVTLAVLLIAMVQIVVARPRAAEP